MYSCDKVVEPKFVEIINTPIKLDVVMLFVGNIAGCGVTLGNRSKKNMSRKELLKEVGTS